MNIARKHAGDFRDRYHDLFCSEHELEARYRYDSLRRKVWYLQCVRCGLWSNPIPKTHPSILQLYEYIEVDEKKRYRTRLMISWQYQEDRQQERAAWWQWYDEYLKSPKWQRRRAAILKRDNFWCQAGFDGCTGTAEHVHHLTYDRAGNEHDDDLVSVCSNCHRSIHPNRFKEVSNEEPF